MPYERVASQKAPMSLDDFVSMSRSTKRSPRKAHLQTWKTGALFLAVAKTGHVGLDELPCCVQRLPRLRRTFYNHIGLFTASIQRTSK